MGSAGKFAIHVFETVKVIEDGRKAALALAVGAYGIFAVGIGEAFGVGWGVATFFAASTFVLFVAGMRLQQKLDGRPAQPLAYFTMAGAPGGDAWGSGGGGGGGSVLGGGGGGGGAGSPGGSGGDGGHGAGASDEAMSAFLRAQPWLGIPSAGPSAFGQGDPSTKAE